MSKYVKDLVTKDIARHLEGVEDALLVNVVGLPATKTFALRKRLRENGMKLLVVKNSLARRASEGTALAGAFRNPEGTLALLWGDTDIISLAKEVVKLQRSGEFAPFEPRGGVMDGEPLTAEGVKAISKWPNREEQLSILIGQILAPGARLSAQLLAPGGALASQIEKIGEGDETDEAAEPTGEAAEPTGGEVSQATDESVESSGDEASEKGGEGT
jgi:large subunit ribosomal protein L10